MQIELNDRQAHLVLSALHGSWARFDQRRKNTDHQKTEYQSLLDAQHELEVIEDQIREAL